MGNSIAKMLRYDKCCYWPVTGRDTHGLPKYGNAVEIQCRWEEGGEMKVTVGAEERFTKHTIYVDRDIEPGAMIWHGLKKDLAKLTPPPPDAVRVENVVGIPDRRNRRKLRWVLT